MIYTMGNLVFFFFFSSRRRHTRFDCDSSSDVCSSDLHSSGTTAAVAARRPLSTIELRMMLIPELDLRDGPISLTARCPQRAVASRYAAAAEVECDNGWIVVVF